ncbi:MAG: tRNA guanosine(34) transglycosylase Tgt [Crocinitomicaceae bacterium TMED114]|nr:MAG: tRNA guanosine(34) transglycosylase Tgt [Crocinitomicaceae bacterium TMED114]
MSFVVESTDPHSRARTGALQTAHGAIRTPIFMPVGTQGSVKAVPQDVLAEEVDPDIILGNTYHMYFRPGLDVLQKAGGLHLFMGWDRPILTDSGGYQVYSLAENRKIKEEGVTFRSHIDGSKHLFTPERAVDIQRVIGADIIMAFDECPPYPCDYAYARQSMELTHRWLDRCIARMNETEPLYGHEQMLFPIVQGSTYDDLRKASAHAVAERQAVGNAIGGLSVGEPHEEMYKSVSLCTEILPEDKPRYLMGVGTPANLLENIALGVDMFDCVMPTRNARNGMLFTRKGTLNMRNLKWQDDFSPLDPDGTTDVDQRYSKAYVRHLFRANEILALQIGSVHNLAFYLDLMREARERIADGTFTAWKDALVPVLTQRL